MYLTPPTKRTFIISLLCALLAFAMRLSPAVAAHIPVSSFDILLAALLLLALGNAITGF